MTKFDEMQQAVSDAIERAQQYQHRSFQNLGKLLSDFREYCQIPTESFLIIPTNKKPEQSLYNVPGAAHFEDGYWCVGMLLSLVNQRVQVQICIREQNGKLLIKFGGQDSPQELDPKDQRQREELFDRIVDRIKRFYSEEDQPEGPEIKRIGFN